MTPEKEQKIYDVYGITPGPWEVVNTGAEDGETKLIARAPSMLIKLWDVLDNLQDVADLHQEQWNVKELENMKQFLSFIHHESLPFDEILRRVDG